MYDLLSLNLFIIRNNYQSGLRRDSCFVLKTYALLFLGTLAEEIMRWLISILIARVSEKTPILRVIDAILVYRNSSNNSILRVYSHNVAKKQ